jgi:hypothetical protein
LLSETLTVLPVSLPVDEEDDEIIVMF